MRRLLICVLAFALFAALPLRYAGAEYGDIHFSRNEPGTGDFPPATYPHWIHRMQFRCYVCHESIFKMKKGANHITMEAIDQGKYCGTCHNGKLAFGTSFGQCFHCHHK